MQGDATVNHALDVQLLREYQWSRKQSTMKNAEEQYPLASANGGNFKHVIEKLKESLNYEKEGAWTSHIRTLLKQGHFLLRKKLI